MFHFWATFLWSSAQQYNKVVPTLTQLSPLTKCQRWSNIGSSILNRRNFFNVVSTLFCPCWNNVNKHMLAQLSFSTKFQRWNNIGSLTLIWRKSIYVVLLWLLWNEIYFGAFFRLSVNQNTFWSILYRLISNYEELKDTQDLSRTTRTWMEVVYLCHEKHFQ